MMASTAGSATHAFTLVRICSMSSRTSARSAHLCPSASISSLSSLPPLSVSSVRVSETTSTAIESGMNGLLGSSSLLNIAGSCLPAFAPRFALGFTVRFPGFGRGAVPGLFLLVYHNHRLCGVGRDDLRLVRRPLGCGTRRLRDVLLALLGARIERYRAGRDALFRRENAEAYAPAGVPHRPDLHPEEGGHPECPVEGCRNDEERNRRDRVHHERGEQRPDGEPRAEDQQHAARHLGEVAIPGEVVRMRHGDGIERIGGKTV